MNLLESEFLSERDLLALATSLKHKNNQVIAFYIGNLLTKHRLSVTSAFAEALRHINTKISVLGIACGDECGSEACCMITSALQHENNQVTGLWLCGTSMGERDAFVLTTTLTKRNNKLTYLNIQNLIIEEYAAREIIATLNDAQCKLTAIDISSTKATSAVVGMFLRAMKDKNNNLRALNVTFGDTMYSSETASNS